ncbi:MAG: hypothetical protein J6U13_07100 [Salinivirgaceae bacterium]|nr:hypothetical protein [Salinivirgaceae bacterium]
MRDLFQNRFLIPSARADWHEYDGGVYFVTICTQNREHYFGEIGKNNNDEPKMELTPIGQFAEEQLRNVTQHYPYAEIPLWVIMPNHVHAIVVINDTNCRDVARNVSANNLENNNLDVALNYSTVAVDDFGKNEYMAQKSPKYGTLSVVMRGIKSAVTKFANDNNISFAWQARFFDHIVRNQNEMNSIAEYIENNVAKWESDKFYNNE